MATAIIQNGGTTVYLQQINNTVFYKTNLSDWITITGWPVSIINSDSNLGIVTLQFTTDLTFNDSNQYFICDSDYIQFGTTNALRPKINIDNILNYPGLFNSNNFNHINIFNLEVLSINGSTLDNNAGWLCQSYFGRNANQNAIVNCYSDGPISGYNSGGILGSYVAQNGNLIVRNCSTSGSISGYGCGGILSNDTGNVSIESCWSVGSISGQNSGGITGPGGTPTIINCYSTGVISGETSGGIIASDPINAIITNCYSEGNITGNFSGGICGAISVNGVLCFISNCYSLGNINGSDSAGGISGYKAIGQGILILNACYTTGQTTGNIGYMIGNSSDVPATCYSESANSSYGWNTSHANSVLTGFPSTQPGVGMVWISNGINQPYELLSIGYTPYSSTNISGINMINYFGSSVSAGNSTINALYNDNSYTILSSPSPTITINPNTGRIQTTSSTPSGNYTMYIRNVKNIGNIGNIGYNISIFVLVVTPHVLPPQPRARYFSISASNRYIRSVPLLRRSSVFTNSVVCTVPVPSICYI